MIFESYHGQNLHTSSLSKQENESIEHSSINVKKQTGHKLFLICFGGGEREFE